MAAKDELQQSPSPQRLLALDGLRGFAVMLVLLDHASDAKMRFFDDANLNRAGKLGVYLFFVLSAFLLTHLFLIRPASELRKPETWLDYFLRRFLRIFPLYAVVLITLFFMHQMDAEKVVNHLLLRDGVKQFWTIPVEVKYYLVLPIIVMACSFIRQRKWLAAFVGSLGVAVTCLAVFYFEQGWSLRGNISLFDNLFPFIAGSVAALLHGVLERRPELALRVGWMLEMVAVIAFAGALSRIPFLNDLLSPSDIPMPKIAGHPAVCGTLWALVIIGLLHGKGFVRKLMEWRPLRYLGLISFSAYLWHEKFLSDLDDQPVPTIVRLFLFLIVVICISSASYFLIEKPLSRIRWGRKPLRPVGQG